MARPPRREEAGFVWPDGTRLTITRGQIVSFDPQGVKNEIAVGMGKLHLGVDDPPSYPLVTVAPVDGMLTIVVDADGVPSD